MGTGLPSTMKMCASGRIPHEAAASHMAIPGSSSNLLPPTIIVAMRPVWTWPLYPSFADDRQLDASAGMHFSTQCLSNHIF